MKANISKGNMKLVGIPNWSLPPVKACPNCALCAHRCYARKAYRLYPSARKAWDDNFALAKTDLAGLEVQLKEWFSSHQPSYFRIHVSGDFFTQKYLNMWIRIARAFPNTRFLAFTKAFKLDYRRKPDNLQILWSVWPGMILSHIPKGPRSYTGTPSDYPTRRKTEILAECPGDCRKCKACWYLKDNEGRFNEFH